MKTIYSIIFCTFLVSTSTFAQKQTHKEGEITAISNKKNINTPCKEFESTIDLTAKTVEFTVPMANFFFKNDTQQKHWSNKVFDTSIFPNATFSGTITSTEDLTIDGTYTISVTGTLKIKDVEKELDAVGTINKKGGSTTATAEFLVDRDAYGLPGMGTDNKIKVVVSTKY